MNVITISNLAPQCCETDLTKLFNPFGDIIRIKLTRKHDQKTRSIEGIAQVVFVSGESAIMAAKHMHGYFYMNKQMIIRQDAPLQKTQQSSQGVKNSVHIRFTTPNIDQAVSKMELLRIFAPYGEINDLVIKASSIDHYAHHQSGYGFVDFSNKPEGLQAALRAVQGVHQRKIGDIQFIVELSRNIFKRIERERAERDLANCIGSYGSAQCGYSGSFSPPYSLAPSATAHHPMSSQAAGTPHYPSHYHASSQPSAFTDSLSFVAPGLAPTLFDNRPPRDPTTPPYLGFSPGYTSALTTEQLEKHNLSCSSNLSFHTQSNLTFSNYSPSLAPTATSCPVVGGDNLSVSSISSRTTVNSTDFNYPLSNQHPTFHSLPLNAFYSSSNPLPTLRGEMYVSEDQEEQFPRAAEEHGEDNHFLSLPAFTLSILSFDQCY